MDRLKRFGILAVTLALIPLFVVFCRVGSRLYRNRKMADSFADNRKMEQYQRKVPMDEMDLLEFDSYFDIPFAAISIRVSNVISLPKKIQYYTEEDGKKIPALEMTKGTNILWIPEREFNGFYVGYGLRGYPTYDKGWRYVKPFMIADKPAGPEQNRYYFIRTKDLETVARAALPSVKGLTGPMRSQTGMSLADAVFTYTRLVDSIFYENGVFCSPDLQRRIWDTPDMLLLCLSAGLLLIVRLWGLRKRNSGSLRREG